MYRSKNPGCNPRVNPLGSGLGDVGLMRMSFTPAPSNSMIIGFNVRSSIPQYSVAGPAPGTMPMVASGCNVMVPEETAVAQPTAGACVSTT